MSHPTPNPVGKRAKRNPVPWQLREFLRRAVVLEKVFTMQREGASLNDAARETGEPLANLSRYVRAFRDLGVRGIVPGIGPGAPAAVAKVSLTEVEADAIAALSYRIVRREDIAAGCRAYAARPDCRPTLLPVLTGRIPLSLRAVIRSRLQTLAK